MPLTEKCSPKTSICPKGDIIKQIRSNQTVHEYWQQNERMSNKPKLILLKYLLNLVWLIIQYTTK